MAIIKRWVIGVQSISVVSTLLKVKEFKVIEEAATS